MGASGSSEVVQRWKKPSFCPSGTGPQSGSPICGGEEEDDKDQDVERKDGKAVLTLQRSKAEIVHHIGVHLPLIGGCYVWF